MPQSAGTVSTRTELLVGLELGLVLILSRDLVSDDDHLGPEAVEPGVIVDALEQMPEHDSVRGFRVGVAGVEARYIDSPEDVTNPGGPAGPQDGRVDACRLTMLPAEGSPVSTATHEFVAVELCGVGDVVAFLGHRSDGVVVLFDAFPRRLVGDSRTDEVEVAVVRLIKVRDQHSKPLREEMVLSGATSDVASVVFVVGVLSLSKRSRLAVMCGQDILSVLRLGGSAIPQGSLYLREVYL